MKTITDRVMTGTLTCRRAGTEPDRPTREERRAHKGWYQMQEPRGMTDRKLLEKLCEVGRRPGRCAKCGNCRYGDEVTRRGGIEQIVLAAQQKRRERHGE